MNMRWIENGHTVFLSTALAKILSASFPNPCLCRFRRIYKYNDSIKRKQKKYYINQMDFFFHSFISRDTVG